MIRGIAHLMACSFHCTISRRSINWHVMNTTLDFLHLCSFLIFDVAFVVACHRSLKLFTVEIDGARIFQYDSNHAEARKMYASVFSSKRKMDATTVSRPTDGFVATVGLRHPGMRPQSVWTGTYQALGVCGPMFCGHQIRFPKN